MMSLFAELGPSHEIYRGSQLGGVHGSPTLSFCSLYGLIWVNTCLSSALDQSMIYINGGGAHRPTMVLPRLSPNPDRFAIWDP